MRSALLAEQAYRQRYKELAQQITEDELKNMKSQMATFKEHLESFAVKYKDEIRKDPEFRAKFQQMCAHIGVDPLASNKNKWSELLGLGDFYYELGIQVIEACIFLRSQPRYGGGGLVDLNAVYQRVIERRSKLVDTPTKEDIEVAIKKLNCLGGGWAIVSIGGHRYVRCVPSELSTDGNVVLDYASKKGGYFCQSQALKDIEGWSKVQLNQAVQGLVLAGMLLVDDVGNYNNNNSVRYYWFPAYGMEASISQYKAEFK